MKILAKIEDWVSFREKTVTRPWRVYLAGQAVAVNAVNYSSSPCSLRERMNIIQQNLLY